MLVLNHYSLVSSMSTFYLQALLGRTNACSTWTALLGLPLHVKKHLILILFLLAILSVVMSARNNKNNEKIKAKTNKLVYFTDRAIPLTSK